MLYARDGSCTYGNAQTSPSLHTPASSVTHDCDDPSPHSRGGEPPHIAIATGLEAGPVPGQGVRRVAVATVICGDTVRDSHVRT